MICAGHRRTRARHTNGSLNGGSPAACVGSGKCQNDQAYVKKGALTVEDEQLTKLANEQTSGNAHVKGNFTLRHEKPMVNIQADGPDRKPDGKDIQYKSGLTNSRDMVDERLNDLG